MNEQGNISINAENIFPIIKKWLYSEKDIFIRELVSNSSDAINKYKKLQNMGDAKIEDDEKFIINVVIDKENKTISVEDNGLGMTTEEVKKYINQIAFSGAKDFLEKYMDKTDDAQIIGHFGLGFYSSFMVSEKVTIDTLSWQKKASPVHWESNDGMDYDLSDSSRSARGTTVTLYLAEDSVEFLDKFTLKQTLTKYFEFLPIEIYIEEVGETSEEEEVPKFDLINDINPIWIKNPRECTDEEYKSFYKKTFNDYNDPLFWIHLNLDYPFNLQGVLYFPKLKHEFESIEGKIKLYYNQVFVADNLKEVIPEFLMLLKGCLDCPDLPLNVSRSFLQNDGTIKKLASHITKKVSDKLNSLKDTDFETYCKYWDDISPFVKYGCLRDEKFFEGVKDIVLLKTIDEKYLTLKEVIPEGEEKRTIYYVNNLKNQAQYVSTFKEHNLEAVVLDTLIDSHFISFIETKEKGLSFKGIDADISEALKHDGKCMDETKANKLIELVKELLGLELVEVKPLKSKDIPALLQQSEESRRYSEMSKNFGGMDMGHLFPNSETLVLNSNNPLVKSLVAIKKADKDTDKTKMLAEYIYDLAVLQTRALDPEAMKKFIERSTKLLQGL
ncbi:MAG: molecular chaperone HtpG [Bacillota bacterium]